MKLLLSIFVLASGLGCAWFYLRRSPAEGESPLGAIRGNRPWRRLGAAICLVLAIMFVLGVYLVDIPQHPRAYAAFWLVMMVLIVWLCVLAVRDVLYTRQVIAKWRAQRQASADRPAGHGGSPQPRAEAEEARS